MLSNFKWQYLPGEPIFKKPEADRFLSLISLLKNKQANILLQIHRNIYQESRSYFTCSSLDVLLPTERPHRHKMLQIQGPHIN